MAINVGQLLLRHNLITNNQLEKALDHQKTNNANIGYNLVKMGFVSDKDVANCLSKHFGISAINLSEIEIDRTVSDLVPVELCRKYCLIPVKRNDVVLVVAFSDPTNIRAIDEISFICGDHLEL